MVSPYALALIVECRGKILLVRELQNKPENGKFRGMLGIPCETFQEEDADDYGTFERMCSEEIGFTLPKPKLYPGMLNFPHGNIVVGYVTVPSMFVVQPQHTHEIAHGGWFTPTEIHRLEQKARRVEVLKILDFHDRSQPLFAVPAK